MGAGFVFEVAVGEWAADSQGDSFVAGFFTWDFSNHLGFPVFGFCEFEVHTGEHGCPVHGFGAALAGVDGENGVFGVVFATHKDADFELVEFFFYFFSF